MASASSSISIKLQNFPAANRDATVTLTNSATGQVIQRKPFLDGTLLVRDIDPGDWQVQVKHPNVVSPLFQGHIKTLPSAFPTFVPVPIRPSDFQDTPIQDIPDADLGPVQQTVAAIRTQVGSIGGKTPGEAIRADDWNRLVGGVSDLAGAVLELVSLVSPRGHDHPEIAAKIDEVQGNLRRFMNSFGNSLLDVRRDIESQNFKRATQKMLDTGGVVGPDRDRILARVDELADSRQASTLEYTTKLANAGAVIAAEVQQIAQAQGDNAGQFLANPDVQNVIGLTNTFAASGGSLGIEEELGTYRKTTVLQAGTKIGGR